MELIIYHSLNNHKLSVCMNVYTLAATRAPRECVSDLSFKLSCCWAEASLLYFLVLLSLPRPHFLSSPSLSYFSSSSSSPSFSFPLVLTWNQYLTQMSSCVRDDVLMAKSSLIPPSYVCLHSWDLLFDISISLHVTG